MVQYKVEDVIVKGSQYCSFTKGKIVAKHGIHDDTWLIEIIDGAGGSHGPGDIICKDEETLEQFFKHESMGDRFFQVGGTYGYNHGASNTYLIREIHQVDNPAWGDDGLYALALVTRSSGDKYLDLLSCVEFNSMSKFD